ncbi:hypothetical protein P7K49_004378 [Saguinus oedipus]|uniref:Uncharacterized protein n=1 Tax=Saguinus oedipus TaxID=9490 RepID=A0ABQ9W781_SAGOE|nr:hypothetical protein P7K49_004378 [Saguinus oedipus]
MVSAVIAGNHEFRAVRLQRLGVWDSNWKPLCSLQAMKYLSYLLYPLCIGGAVYSLLNIKYKR